MPKKSITSPPGKKRDYDSFLRSVKLYSISLDGCTAKIDRDKYWEDVKASDSLTREISAGYTAAEVANDHFDVVAELSLNITEKKRKAVVVEISCKYSAHFHASVDCSSETADRFAKSEGKIIIWPYFRSLVDDLTARMHIPPITVPLALE
jgi:hypothetical protein